MASTASTGPGDPRSERATPGPPSAGRCPGLSAAVLSGSPNGVRAGRVPHPSFPSPSVPGWCAPLWPTAPRRPRHGTPDSGAAGPPRTHGNRCGPSVIRRRARGMQRIVRPAVRNSWDSAECPLRIMVFAWPEERQIAMGTSAAGVTFINVEAVLAEHLRGTRPGRGEPLGSGCHQGYFGARIGASRRGAHDEGECA